MYMFDRLFVGLVAVFLFRRFLSEFFENLMIWVWARTSATIFFGVNREKPNFESVIPFF